MDKLKEFQKYQFWVLLAVALILPLVGWIMARSGLVAAAEARTKTLTDLSNSLKATPEDPNQDWQAKLDQINKVQEEQIRLAWLQLYENQTGLMTWPKNINPEVMGSRDVELYRKYYKDEVEKIRQIVKPIDDVNGELVEEPGRLVNLPDALVPHPDVDWTNEPPLAKQVFAAQEDLWLLAALLNAINSVNENATSQLDAPVREVVSLIFRGGSPKTAGGAKTASTSASAMGPAGNPMMEMMKSMRSSSDSGMSGGGIGIEPASFNADDEFGEQVEEKDASKPATGTGAAPAGGPSTGMSMLGPMADMQKMMAGGRGGMGTSTANMKRYVEEKTEWKTRGFYLEVIMDQRHVPHLMVALSNAEWPIKILRVHQADLNEETLATSSAGGMPGGMGPMGRAGATPGMDMMKKMMGAAGPGGRQGYGTAPMRNPGRDLDDDGPGARPLGSPRLGGSRPMRGEGATGGADGMSALDDPMLVTVAVDGLFTIFNKPPEEKAAAQPGVSPQQQTIPPTAGQDGTTPATSAEPATTAVTPADKTDEAEAVPAAAAENTEGEEKKPAADTPESPPASEAPASETPATDEKPAPDSR